MNAENKLKDLENMLEKTWGKDTCYPGMAGQWSRENPSYGQCAVTALLVQMYFGGSILYCSHNHHYWNMIACGLEADLTKKQFPKGIVICCDGHVERDYLLRSPAAEAVRTNERYGILKKRVEEMSLFGEITSGLR